jgi:hypothetical protein
MQSTMSSEHSSGEGGTVGGTVARSDETANK